MKPDETRRMYELCALIEKEKDHNRFVQLIQELNQLLQSKRNRLDQRSGPSITTFEDQ
jgi:hypothetical protein